EGLATLRSRLAKFAADHLGELGHASPEMPDGFNNRLEANWKPLLAIAEICGVGDEARTAAVTLSCRPEEASIRIELLKDMVVIVKERNDGRMHSDDIVNGLVGMENRPWGEWGYRNPKPITKHQIANLLKPLGIQPEQMKIGGVNRNGYALEALEPALTRYQVSTSLPSLKNKELGEICPETLEAEVESQIPLHPLEMQAGRAVESQKAPKGRSVPLCDHCGGVEEHGNSLWSETRDG